MIFPRYQELSRFFVTTRDIPDVQQLLGAHHVDCCRFDHNDEFQAGDVQKVTRVHLKEIAEENNLEGWPTVEVEEENCEEIGGVDDLGWWLFASS